MLDTFGAIGTGVLILASAGVVAYVGATLLNIRKQRNKQNDGSGGNPAGTKRKQ